MFVSTGFYASFGSGDSPTSGYYSADIWNLTDVNTVIGAYNKNPVGAELGKYQRGAGVYYSSELLCKSSTLETAITGKTISEFSVEYTVTANNMVADLSTTGCQVSVFNCSVSWTDTPTTQPRFNVPFGENTAWGTAAITDSTVWKKTTSPVYVTPTGVYNSGSNAAMVSMAQGWADGSNKYGLVLSMDPRYYLSTITISTVRFYVKYT